MKLIRILLGLCIIAGLVFIPAGTAKAFSLSITTCLAIQNLEAVDASITMTFYPTGGGTPTTVADTVTASSLKTLCNLSVAAGFSGSAVISSSTRLAVVTNLINQTYDGLAASYTGFSQGSTTMTFPLLMKSNAGYNTQFSIQNAGTAQALVSVTYSDGQGNTVNEAIEPGQSKVYNQDAEPHAAGWVGSAMVTATGSPIVGVALETNNTVLFAYNGMDPATTATTTPLFPIILGNVSGFITGMSIQNTTATPSDVTVSFTPTSAGTACTETHNVPANSTALFALNAWNASQTGSNCTVGQTFIGFAKVTTNSANVNLVGVVNQLNIATNKGDSYDGINPTTGTGSVLLPLVMDHNSGYFTGANLVNVGANAVNITCHYTNTTAADQVFNNVAAGAGVTVAHLNYFTSGVTPAVASYVGAGTCTAVESASPATAGKIVGIVNQLKNTGVKDTFMVYQAINQ